MTKNVYLAGRIEDLTYEQASQWRKEAAFLLGEAEIPSYDPCEHIPSELREGIVTIARVAECGGRSEDEIYAQDMFHLNNTCNIFLVNLNDPGVGTLVEVGIAFNMGITIVGFGASAEHCLHPFLYKTCLLMNTMGEAVDFIINI